MSYFRAIFIVPQDTTSITTLRRTVTYDAEDVGFISFDAVSRMSHQKALVRSRELHRSRVVVEAPPRAHSREEQFDVVLAQFVGEQVPHRCVVSANQIVEDVSRTSHTYQKTKKRGFAFAVG